MFFFFKDIFTLKVPITAAADDIYIILAVCVCV